MMHLLRSSLFRSSSNTLVFSSSSKALTTTAHPFRITFERWENQHHHFNFLRRHTVTTDTSSAGYSSLKTTTPPQPQQPQIVLYQYAICPFCNKTKALLDYARVDYHAIEVNPLTKSEIKWSTDYKKVPIAKIIIDNDNNTDNNNEIVWKGSDDIIQGLLQEESVIAFLKKRWASTTSQAPGSIYTLQDFVGGNVADLGGNNNNDSSGNSNKKSDDVKEWLRFANDELATLLYPNICRTWSDSYQAFSYVHQIDSFSTIQKISIQLLGSVAMHFAASRVKKKRNITDEQKALEDALATVIARLEGGNNAFLSGMQEPHLGDLVVYGVLRGIEGLPTHSEIVMDREGPLKDWYVRMQRKVNSKQ